MLHSPCIFSTCFSVSPTYHLPTSWRPSEMLSFFLKSLCPLHLTDINLFFRVHFCEDHFTEVYPDLLGVGQAYVKHPRKKCFSFTTLMACLNYIFSSVIIWLTYVLLLKTRTQKVRTALVTTGAPAQSLGYRSSSVNVYEWGQHTYRHLLIQLLISSLFIYMYLLINSFSH